MWERVGSADDDLGDGVALAADVEAVCGFGYAYALQGVVFYCSFLNRYVFNAGSVPGGTFLIVERIVDEFKLTGLVIYLAVVENHIFWSDESLYRIIVISGIFIDLALFAGPHCLMAVAPYVSAYFPPFCGAVVKVNGINGSLESYRTVNVI